MGQNLTEGSNPSLSVLYDDPPIGIKVPGLSSRIPGQRKASTPLALGLGTERPEFLVVYLLKRISVWPVVKIAFVVNGVIGLFLGGLYGAFVFLIGGLADLMGGDQIPENLGAFTGIIGIFLTVFLGILHGVFGAVFAAVATWLYNLIANIIGGVEFTLEPQETPEESIEPLEPVPPVQTPESLMAMDPPSSPDPPVVDPPTEDEK